MQKILVATDGSENATSAVRFAANLAAGMHAKLSIVTVANSIPGEDMKRLAFMEHVSSGEMAALDAENTLAEARSIAAEFGAEIGRCFSLVGDTAEIIFDLIADEQPDTVVVGRRGRGRLAGLLLGSISQKLASLCPCAAIIVPHKVAI